MIFRQQRLVIPEPASSSQRGLIFEFARNVLERMTPIHGLTTIVINTFTKAKLEARMQPVCVWPVDQIDRI
jgi:hypothetical protein